MNILALFGLPGGGEWIVILIVALLVFGRRLPDVARSMGKSIVEFKKGLNDVRSEIDVKSRLESTSSSTPVPAGTKSVPPVMATPTHTEPKND